MQELLEKQGFRVYRLNGPQATRAKIISVVLDSIAPALQDRDRVLFFFSGHGTTRIFGGETYGYIVPYDGTQEVSSLLSYTELREMSFQLKRAKHQLFVLNACFGGLFAKLALEDQAGNSTPEYIRQVSVRAARQVLTAGGDDQRVRATGEKGHTYFGAFLLQALKGDADLDENGVLTFAELGAWLAPRASNFDQAPIVSSMMGDAGGQFLFLPKGISTKLLREIGAPSTQPTSGGSLSQNDGDWKGQDSTAAATEKNNSPRFLTDAVGLTSKCKAGADTACIKLAFAYRTGKGITRDPGHAVEMYRIACDRKYGRGCWGLSLMHSRGWGASTDITSAKNYRKTACDLGDVVACTEAAVILARNGGPADTAAANSTIRSKISLVDSECLSGYIEACTTGGAVYGAGDGMQPDVTKAMALYFLACSGGEPTSCMNIAVHYAEGLQGVPLNRELAHEYYVLACQGGEDDACREVD